jgi:multidrug resistance protein MdtO
MAANAIEVSARWRMLRGYLVKASAERWEFTTRLALICALTTLVTEIYQTPEPALTAYVAFFLNRPERTLSLIMSVALTLLISIVIAIVFLVAKVVADDPLWRVISIAVISFGLLFLASASKLRPVAGTIALIVGYALDLLGTIHMGEEATRALLYAWLFVAIPAGVSLIINFVLAPAPRRVAEHAIGSRLRCCSALLREPASAGVRQAFWECTETGVADIREQLKLAGVERSASVRDISALQQAALSTAALTGALEVLESIPEAQLPRETRHAIATTLDDMALILEDGAYPVEVTVAWPTEGALSPIAQRVFAGICDAVTRFAEPDEATKIAPTPSEGFFVKDAFTNPEHVHYALKTTGAAVFCYCLYSLLDWPGIHTCFLTCYIVAQATAAESVEKLTLRIAGCVVGAAAGLAAIVFLVPYLTSIGGLLLAVFAGAWIAAYVAAGSPRVSYAGFQFAFAFFLCLIQGAGPQFDLEIARDRIIGILIGNMVAYIAFVHIWAMTIGRRIDPALASVLDRMRELVLAQGSRNRQLIAAEVTSSLAAVSTDLELARYEPASIRASDGWLSSRREGIERSRSLRPLLLLSQEQDDVRRGLIGTRLTELSANLAGHASAKSDAPNAPCPLARGITLSGLIEETLTHLEGTLKSPARNIEADPLALP